MRPFKTFDDAIEQANRLPYGLAAYCFTENGRRALVLGEAIESGMIGINTTVIGGAGDTTRPGIGFQSRDLERTRQQRIHRRSKILADIRGGRSARHSRLST